MLHHEGFSVIIGDFGIEEERKLKESGRNLSLLI